MYKSFELTVLGEIAPEWELSEKVRMDSDFSAVVFFTALRVDVCGNGEKWFIDG